MSSEAVGQYDAALLSLAVEAGGSLIGVDTSGATSSLCTVNPHSGVVWSTHLSSAAMPSESLVEALAEQTSQRGLRPHELACVVVALGPGSFTGLRVGLATVKGLCMAAGVPALGVSSLAVLAASAPAGPLVAPVLDARRDEVFAAVFRREGGHGQAPCKPLVGDGVFAPSAVAAQARAVAGDAGLVWIGDFAERLAQMGLVGSQDRVLQVAPDMRAGILLVADRLRARDLDRAETLSPQYLRLSEPERKLQAADRAAER